MGYNGKTILGYYPTITKGNYLKFTTCGDSHEEQPEEVEILLKNGKKKNQRRHPFYTMFDRLRRGEIKSFTVPDRRRLASRCDPAVLTRLAAAHQAVSEN